MSLFDYIMKLLEEDGWFDRHPRLGAHVLAALFALGCVASPVLIIAMILILTR
jgi:hypothetical protein